MSWITNDILTIDQQWLLNQSDFPSTLWPWYRAWPSPNYEWFPLSICNGCCMPAGNAYPSGHLVPSPFLGHACAPIRNIASNVASTFTRTCRLFSIVMTSWKDVGNFGHRSSPSWSFEQVFLGFTKSSNPSKFVN